MIHTLGLDRMKDRDEDGGTKEGMERTKAVVQQGEDSLAKGIG